VLRKVASRPVHLVLLVLVSVVVASSFLMTRDQMSALFKNEGAKRRPTTKIAGLVINRDLIRYREHYPSENINMPGRTSNLRFYKNQIRSIPDGDFIDEIHIKWYGDYRTLEVHHGYVQWLFPIHEEGMNYRAQILQVHERQAMIKDAAVIERVKKSYELILDFYGANVVDWQTGELERTQGYARRFINLNTRFHNYLRITRILKWLGEMNLEHLKFSFLVFFAQEAIFLSTIPKAAKSLEDFWLATLRDDTELELAVHFVDGSITFEKAMSLVRHPEKRGYKVKDIAAALHLTSGQPQHGPHRRGDPAATPTQQGHESSLLSTDEKGGAKGGSVKGSGDKGLGNVGVKRNANGSVSSDEKTVQQTSPEQEKALSSDDELDPDSQRLDAGARARVTARKEEGVVSRSSQTQGSQSSISGDAEEKGGGEVTGGEGEGGGADEL